jgi:hypothetical protein
MAWLGLQCIDLCVQYKIECGQTRQYVSPIRESLIVSCPFYGFLSLVSVSLENILSCGVSYDFFHSWSRLPMRHDLD